VIQYLIMGLLALTARAAARRSRFAQRKPAWHAGLCTHGNELARVSD
jgi:hypothetical protein